MVGEVPAELFDGCIAGQDPRDSGLELWKLAMEGTMEGDWTVILTAFFLYLLCLLGCLGVGRI